MKNNAFIISLGGSLIVPPGGIDSEFLKKFRTLVLSQVKNGKKFFIVTGGGSVCRQYNAAAKKITNVSPADLDWLGIYSSRLNALLAKTMFGAVAYPEIIVDPATVIKTRKNIVLAGGWKPGRSTDYVAVALARTYGAKTVINLSNIDYAYDRNPQQFPNAKKIERINWRDFRKIVGSRWNPGVNLPFDPVASRLAQKLKLRVIIVNGKNLKNLHSLLEGKNFRGTIIEG